MEIVLALRVEGLCQSVGLIGDEDPRVRVFRKEDLLPGGVKKGRLPGLFSSLQSKCFIRSVR